MARKSPEEVARILSDALTDIGDDADPMMVMDILCAGIGGMIPALVQGEHIKLDDLQRDIWGRILKGVELITDEMEARLKRMAEDNHE